MPQIIVDSYSLCSTCGFSISLCGKVLFIIRKIEEENRLAKGTGYIPKPSSRKYWVLNITDLCCSESQLTGH